MKYLLYTLIIIMSQTAFADVMPYTENEEFTKWHDVEDFKEVLHSVPNDMYPAIIQAGALVGDGVVYRVLFNSKPSENFKYRFIFGSPKKEFTDLNNKYSKTGFILIHCQSVQLMGGKAYQAVWVKQLKE